MENLKLNFDTSVNENKKTLVVEVPYQEGLVATSLYCPTKMLEGSVDLMAAVRGETLDEFIDRCRSQLLAYSKIQDEMPELDRHIGALMATVLSDIDSRGEVKYGELLSHLDCFSLLLKADGFREGEIRELYPLMAQTLQSLYPDYIRPA